LIDGIISIVVFEDILSIASIRSVVVVTNDDVLDIVGNVFSIIFEVALDIVVGIICCDVVV
jgi:hypothetical protein